MADKIDQQDDHDDRHQESRDHHRDQLLRRLDGRLVFVVLVLDVAHTELSVLQETSAAHARLDLSGPSPGSSDCVVVRYCPPSTTAARCVLTEIARDYSRKGSCQGQKRRFRDVRGAPGFPRMDASAQTRYPMRLLRGGTRSSHRLHLWQKLPPVPDRFPRARSSMDRVLPSEGRGCWFDPSRARQFPQGFPLFPNRGA